MNQKKPYQSRFNPILRTIALVLVISFALSDISHAAPAATINLNFLSPNLAVNPSLLKLSPQVAKIGEVHHGTAPRFLIHIQDAHTNFSAQENIAKVLEELITRYKVKTVFVEGGTGDDSLSFIRPLAKPAARERVAEPAEGRDLHAAAEGFRLHELSKGKGSAPKGAEISG